MLSLAWSQHRLRTKTARLHTAPLAIESQERNEAEVQLTAPKKLFIEPGTPAACRSRPAGERALGSGRLRRGRAAREPPPSGTERHGAERSGRRSPPPPAARPPALLPLRAAFPEEKKTQIRKTAPGSARSGETRARPALAPGLPARRGDATGSGSEGPRRPGCVRAGRPLPGREAGLRALRRRGAVQTTFRRAPSASSRLRQPRGAGWWAGGRAAPGLGAAPLKHTHPHTPSVSGTAAPRARLGGRKKGDSTPPAPARRSRS